MDKKSEHNEVYETIKRGLEDAVNGRLTEHMVEYAPVVHGEWIMFERPNGGYYKGCSLCTYPMPTDMELDYLCEEDNRYCYNCGAKMDGERRTE